VRRHLELFLAYFVQYFKVRISYRADFLIGLFTSFAATLFAFAFVLVLFRRVSLPGWRFPEIVFLYGFSLIPFGLFNVLSLNIYEFGSLYIMEGKFDRVLLRPLHSLFQVVFEAFRIESFQEVFTGLALVIWASQRLQIHWSALDIVLLAFFGVCGGVIYVSFFLILSAVSFWFEDRIGIHPPAWNLIAFGRYPLTIYSGYIRFILSWIIPFGFASFYPTVRLLNRAEMRAYAPLVPLMAAATFGVMLWCWSRGVRHYSSTGS
jgi:ABC-2 type transport system permease protein